MGLGGTTHSRTIMGALKCDNNNNDKIFISDLNHWDAKWSGLKNAFFTVIQSPDEIL